MIDLNSNMQARKVASFFAPIEQKQTQYFDIFIDYKIPLWKRIIGGAGLPVLGPLFLLTGCANTDLQPIPREKPAPDDWIALPPEEEEPTVVEENETADDDDTAEEAEPVEENNPEPFIDDETVDSDDDTVDDDIVDEELNDDCEPGIYRPCGPCDLGLMACTSDYRWSECMGLPEEWIAACYNGPVGTAGVGICREGLQECRYDHTAERWEWGNCEAEIAPTAEVCDELDNDCNGRVDDETTNCGGYDCVAGQCGPFPLVCAVTDSFEFGDDFSSHNYEQSTWVGMSEDSVHSCGAARGIYFEANGEWVKVSLTVDPRAESVNVYTRSHNAFSIIRLDGFDCHNPIVGSFCYASASCSLTTSTWDADRFSSPRFVDGQVDLTITGAGVREGFFGPSPDDEHPDIATIEIESCFRAIP